MSCGSGLRRRAPSSEGVARWLKSCHELALPAIRAEMQAAFFTRPIGQVRCKSRSQVQSKSKSLADAIDIRIIFKSECDIHISPIHICMYNWNC